VHESSNLADFVSPPLPKTMAVMLQKLIGAKYCLALPLYVGKENLGVMLFVFKVPKDQLNSKDLEMAQAIANDTTLAIERSQAFQKLKDANEYLSQLDKMKDEFISVASHELNTPLAAIEGYLSMILDEGMGKIDDKSRMYLGRAYDSSKRLAELILDLLNTSRIEQGRLKMKYSEVNLAELIQSVIHELQIKADGKKIYLKMEAPKVVPVLWCDPDRIREVIVNLTGNAIKFTEKGGVTIKIEQPDHTLRVSVIDTGRGIDKADQNKLFQKFSQVKREIDEHQGTGLGLYISKSFVDLHKGRLWVESEAGKGAAFIFELPIIDKPPKEVPGAILESTFGSPRIEVGTKEAPAIIAASSKKSS
jgi:signal transduction histidine kinase